MSNHETASNSYQWIGRMSLNPEMFTRLYDDRARWRTDYRISAEMSDFFTARFIAEADRDSRDAYDDNHVLSNWQEVLVRKLASELGSRTFLDTSGDGAREFGWLAFEFAAWAARSADMALNEHGARMLGGMMSSGFASFIGIWDEVGDDKEYSHNPITLDNGDYDARVLKAWDDDIRMLDFYRHGVFVRADIERFISDDVDPALASIAAR